ncbi:hypothetical protein LAUMK35_01390 [Mycobacterium pseudokansasii]|uniref:Uncharacterized protein n=1 Tax=Mycobacterium pseudokansasii TaxID=2341080 RepID=A0A498QLV5_9MYCO|nr:hypothetical protein LAUMK35_01390 [Mycobacterium pseudokansasii]VAZ91734.1 hypothetical protein LAUMK21_01390 [Mycobacterium pseudokansasii]VBA48287.1 hypothetical protein LAUMK142_01244 [Mycobacterium pseudokansasii]
MSGQHGRKLPSDRRCRGDGTSSRDCVPYGRTQCRDKLGDADFGLLEPRSFGSSAAMEATEITVTFIGNAATLTAPLACQVLTARQPGLRAGVQAAAGAGVEHRSTTADRRHCPVAHARRSPGPGGATGPRSRTARRCHPARRQTATSSRLPARIRPAHLAAAHDQRRRRQADGDVAARPTCAAGNSSAAAARHGHHARIQIRRPFDAAPAVCLRRHLARRGAQQDSPSFRFD